jgi:hypothetical protein
MTDNAAPSVTVHEPMPLRMVGRKAQPRRCSCGRSWPCAGIDDPELLEEFVTSLGAVFRNTTTGGIK